MLGKSPAWPDRGGACSGYLVTEGDFSLLLDCGTGVLAELRRVQDYLDLDAIVISHLHADHVLDLIPFSFALTLSPRASTATRRLPLHGPPDSGELFRRLGGCFGDPERIEDAFRVEEYDPPADLTVGPFTVRFQEVPHYTRSFAVEIGLDGRRFTYGADSAPNDALVEFATGTDLLAVEGTLRQREPSGRRGHMTPREAGETGRRANARRLLVTHFSDELDRDWIRSEATAGFGAEVELAAAGAAYVV